MEAKDFYVSPALDVLDSLVAAKSFLQTSPGGSTGGDIPGEGEDEG